MLTPYELEVCLDQTKWKEVYPMDFYSLDGGSWSNMYHRNLKNKVEIKYDNT